MIQDGRPFLVRMADGREYPVPHPDYISISPKATYVTIYDDEEKFYMLPLLTMTGLAGQPPGSEAPRSAPGEAA